MLEDGSSVLYTPSSNSLMACLMSSLVSILDRGRSFWSKFFRKRSHWTFDLVRVFLRSSLSSTITGLWSDDPYGIAYSSIAMLPFLSLRCPAHEIASVLHRSETYALSSLWLLSGAHESCQLPIVFTLSSPNTMVFDCSGMSKSIPLTCWD